MAKKRPAINLPRPTDAHSGDLAKLFTAGEDVERGLVDTDRRGIPNDIPTSKST